MMDRKQLKANLDRIRVPESYYNLGTGGFIDEKLVLGRTDDGKWEVFYAERGHHAVRGIFDTEQEACAYMYRVLREYREDGMDNYLPLGRVVMLKETTRKLVIVARAVQVENNGKVFFFDYGGVIYPVGVTGDQIAYFQKDAIDSVIFKGFLDEEEEAANETINRFVAANPDLLRGSAENFN